MEGPYGNAMTEIALALAMAFFSVMVLAMVSMGAAQPETAEAPEMVNPARFEIVRSEPNAAQSPLPDDTRIVIFHHNRFFDTDLKDFDIAGVGPDDTVILAIDPALALADAVVALTRLKAANITVTTLDPRWLRTLKEIKQ